ncbi:hypothetical protein [Kitasatospora sp. NPDC059327]|uniref:hypothetical protein n=1 Tax=Kitasatospora sp. NPDC059327 TaxID=3346803 RepID=UPI0036834E19
MNVENPAGPGWPEPTCSFAPPARAAVDQAVAAERCELLLREALDGVRPELSWRHAVPCAGARLPAPGSGPADGGVQWYVGRGRDIVTIISAARRGELPALLEAGWRRRGWTITSVNACRDLPGVAAVTPDGYRLALEFGALGEARLTATSPGVARSEWVEGVCGGPELPVSAAGVTSLPEIWCPYWSALG